MKDIGELTEEDLKNEINEHLEKSNDIVEGMIANEKYTIIAIFPTTTEYSKEYAKDYETISDHIKTIEKSIKLK